MAAALEGQVEIERFNQLKAQFVNEFRHETAAMQLNASFPLLLDTNRVIQTEQHRIQLKRKFGIDNLYVLTRDFKGSEKLRQLTQNEEDIVGVLKYFDPTGQETIWLVDNGSKNQII